MPDAAAAPRARTYLDAEPWDGPFSSAPRLRDLSVEDVRAMGLCPPYRVRGRIATLAAGLPERATLLEVVPALRAAGVPARDLLWLAHHLKWFQSPDVVLRWLACDYAGMALHRYEVNTLRDIQSEAPTLPLAWRDVVWTPSRVERQDDADADVLAAAEALATADAALQSAQPGSHDETACELAREEAVTAILEAVAKRRPLDDPEPTMAPRKLGSVSSLLGDGDGRPF